MYRMPYIITYIICRNTFDRRAEITVRRPRIIAHRSCDLDHRSYIIYYYTAFIECQLSSFTRLIIILIRCRMSDIQTCIRWHTPHHTSQHKSHQGVCRRPPPWRSGQRSARWKLGQAALGLGSRAKQIPRNAPQRFAALRDGPSLRGHPNSHFMRRLPRVCFFRDRPAGLRPGVRASACWADARSSRGVAGGRPRRATGASRAGIRSLGVRQFRVVGLRAAGVPGAERFRGFHSRWGSSPQKDVSRLGSNSQTSPLLQRQSGGDPPCIASPTAKGRL